MSKQVVLLRVGIDSGSGGIQSPLFADGSFEFLCIPDKWQAGNHTYGNLLSKNGQPIVNYFPPSLRLRMADKHVHIDPEFETCTYGDPTTLKRSLRRLNSGDYLVFYCGLQRWSPKSGWRQLPRPSLYLAGFFEVTFAGMASDFRKSILKREFGKNFHVRHKALFDRQKNDLVLVKGGSQSRLFRKACKISTEGKDRAGKPLKVLSSKMQKVFSTFGGKTSIQRSPPRWVESPFVDKAIDFIRELE